MQVICTDGTAFPCEGYELTEYGAMIYGQEPDPDSERDRYRSDPEQVAYIPHDRLWYILPEGVTPNVGGVQGMAVQQSLGAAAGAQPPDAQANQGPPRQNHGSPQHGQENHGQPGTQPR